jgi:hypothetical protein
MKLIRSVGVKKHAARKWTNYGLCPPSLLLAPAGGWATGSSSLWRSWSPSFEDGVGLEGLVKVKKEIVDLDDE